MRQAVCFAEEVTVKPAVLISPPPLLRWFYQHTKNHTAIHCIRIHMLFTDGGACLERVSENRTQLQKQKIDMWWPMLMLWRTDTNKQMCGKHRQPLLKIFNSVGILNW